MYFRRIQTRARALYLSVGIAVTLALTASSVAVPQEFTYQALLTNPGGAPLSTTNATVKLDIFPSSVGGTLLATQTFTALNLSASGGYVNLTVTNLPDTTGDLYVEVTVTDVAGAIGPETLTPRQKVSSVPFALRAEKLAGRTLMVKPGEDINAAYTKAKTMGPGYQNRVVVMLLPGEHVVNSSIVMDAEGIDLVGFGNKNASITGSANPLINATVNGGTGATIRSLILQPTDVSNRGIDIVSGRIQDVIINPLSSGAPLTINASTNNVSVKDFEIYGNVVVTSFGAGSSFTNGFITGSVTSTANSASATAALSFINVGAIGSVSFQPTVAGILLFGNVPQVTGITINSSTIIRAGSTGFTNAAGSPLAIANPAAGSLLANCLGNATAWTGTTASTGNIAGVYSAFLAK